MPTPFHEIEMLQREYLDSEDLDLFKDSLAFAVAEKIVKYNDPELLNHMPSWVGNMVRQMCDEYQRTGTYVVISSVGMADHSEMMKRLAALL